MGEVKRGKLCGLQTSQGPRSLESQLIEKLLFHQNPPVIWVISLHKDDAEVWMMQFSLVLLSFIHQTQN